MKAKAKCKKELIAVTKLRFPRIFWFSAHTSKTNIPLNKDSKYKFYN